MVTGYSHCISPMLPAMHTAQATYHNHFYVQDIEETRLITTGGEDPGIRFLSSHTRTDESDEREGKRTSQTFKLITKGNYLVL